MKKLLVIAVIAILAGSAVAVHIDIASDSCPVLLKIMPYATVVAPDEILVDITEVDSDGMGSSSGEDYGTFHIGTNQTDFQLIAEIGEDGLSGGTWSCMLQGDPDGDGFEQTSSYNYDTGPVPDGTPFDVFVKVDDVDMTAIAFEDVYKWDTILTLTLATQ
ncbi:MAG: hypothetical protein ACYSSI_02775 [Planctomycetota bacterium]|jgi:hypothetical protein